MVCRQISVPGTQRAVACDRGHRSHTPDRAVLQRPRRTRLTHPMDSRPLENLDEAEMARRAQLPEYIEAMNYVQGAQL